MLYQEWYTFISSCYRTPTEGKSILLSIEQRNGGPIACNIYVLCNSVLPFVQGYGEILLGKAPI